MKKIILFTAMISFLLNFSGFFGDYNSFKNSLSESTSYVVRGLGDVNAKC